MTHDQTLQKLKNRLPLKRIIFLEEHIDFSDQLFTFFGPCPFHKGDGLQLAIDKDKQTWRCVVCHIRDRDVIDFYMLKNDVGYETAIKALGRKAKLNIEPILAYRSRMRTFNKIRRLFFFPFRLIVKIIMLLALPSIAGVGFLMTDWENESDVKYYKYVVMLILKFKLL